VVDSALVGGRRAGSFAAGGPQFFVLPSLELIALIARVCLLDPLGEDLSDRVDSDCSRADPPVRDAEAISRQAVGLGDSVDLTLGAIRTRVRVAERRAALDAAARAGRCSTTSSVRGDGLERLAARLPARLGLRGELRRQLPRAS